MYSAGNRFGSGDMMTPNVIALIRFSYQPRSGSGFRQMRDRSLDERNAILFDPGRLAARFALFEAVCLPSLTAQNPDLFGAVLLTSAALPEPFKDRLRALTADYPNIEILFRGPSGVDGEFADALADRFDTAAEVPPPRATLRLDDDDALSSDFSDYMQDFLVPGHEGYAVTFPSGFVLNLRAERMGGWAITEFCHSVGLAFVNRRPWTQHVYHLRNHNTVPERHRTLADASRPMFLRVRHEYNDSNMSEQPETFDGSQASLSALGDGRFGFLDAEALRRTQATWVRPERS
jgi:hypothetical protein